MVDADHGVSLSSQQQLYTVSSADILRLIQAHLTECGLHQTVRTLQRESGVGAAASSQHTPWKQLAMTGQWAAVLQGLAGLDKYRIAAASGGAEATATSPTTTATAPPAIQLIASIHEMAILELAEVGEWESAYAVFRFFQKDESMVSIVSELSAHASKDRQKLTIGRSLEQKLAALAAARQTNDTCAIPDDYYGLSATLDSAPDGSAQTAPIHQNEKQSRRTELGQRLQDIIPKQPPQRLLTLVQQAIKWQSYTGQLPHIRRYFAEEDEDGVQQRTKRRKTKEFDLVLGEVSVDSTTVGSDRHGSMAIAKGKSISRDYAKVKFGKNVVCTAATFMPDGSGIVTGSSDGLIEIWGMDGVLRTSDLPYQQREELLGHDNGASITALTVSNDTTMLASGGSDGTVNIWKIESGQCLRTLQTFASSSTQESRGHGGGISFLSFSPDGSRVLSAHDDGTCREFGLRTARMLKEFSGHLSYVTSCSYELIPQAGATPNGDDTQDATLVASSSRGQQTMRLAVVTSSGDGTVRIWDGTTANVLLVLRPISIGMQHSLSAAGSSIRVIDSAVSDQVSSSGSPAILAVLKLHTPAHTFIVVPRGQRAFLVNCHGVVLRTFQDGSRDAAVKQSVFVAGAVSATNRWFYAVQDSGSCCVFDVTNGKLDQTLNDFASQSTSAPPSGGQEVEVSSIMHHPVKDIVAAFSSDKRQKRGKLVLWK